VTIPKEQIDKELPGKLLGEAEGILAWAVGGAGLWYTEGLNKPAEVEAAKYQWREDMDQLGRFVDERCVKGDRLARPIIC
jgi:putative DNA primase/helicase